MYIGDRIRSHNSNQLPGGIFVRSCLMAESTQETPSEPPPDYEASVEQHASTLPVRSGPPSSRPELSGLQRTRAMELPILTFLRDPTRRIILASASPRRRALLGQVSTIERRCGLFYIAEQPTGHTWAHPLPQLGLTNLEILPSTLPEDLSKAELGPLEYAAATARRKCLDVYQRAVQHGAVGTRPADSRVKDGADPEAVVSADTIIVTSTGAILEKPRSAADHARMLRHLRDSRCHKVVSAVCVVAPRADAAYPGYELASAVEETKVYFASEEDGLGDDVIDAYVNTREGVDKAGGYAIQGIAGLMLVEKVEGAVDNVVGLPVRRTLAMLEKVLWRQGERGDAEEDEESDD